VADEAVRVDVWLWRARFCKTRAAAANLAEAGRIRLTRGGAETRLDKASRTLRAGDDLIFAVGGRLAAVRVVALGARRGPASEARGLYAVLEPPGETAASPATSVERAMCGIDKDGRGP
jgi:ribosome-associated heat shock protein Hsp15